MHCRDQKTVKYNHALEKNVYKGNVKKDLDMS